MEENNIKKNIKKSPSLKSQASAIFIGNLLGTIFQFLVPAIIVRMISQDDFGVFRQFQLVGGTFVSLLGMGYNSSLFYFYPIMDSEGRQKIIQQTQLLFMFNLMLFFIILFSFGDEILTYFNFDAFVEMKTMIFLFVAFLLLSTGINWIFTLEKNTKLNKIYPSIEKISRFLIFIIIISIIPGFKGPIIALIVFALFRLVYYIIHLSPYFKKIHKIDYKLLKEQLLYSLPFGLALILNNVSGKFDKFYINQYITPKEFGIYSIAFLSIPILKQFFQSIHNVVVPEITIYMNGNRIREATILWQKTVDKTSSIAIPAVFLFWLLANEIITILYTIKYVEAANYYRIFILMFFVSMFSYNIILRASNKTKYILITSIIGTILTVILGFIIIPLYGLYGAIITAFTGSVVPMLISLHIERKIMNLSIRNWVNWKNIFNNFLICFLVALPLFFSKDYIDNVFLRLFVVASVFIVLITLLQIKFNIFIFTKYIPSIKKYFKI